jgi:hypothetical protein
MSTPLMSSWLRSLSITENTVTLTTKDGQRLQYTQVPEPILHALQVAGSPGRIWHVLLKGKFNEKVLSQ